VSLSGVELSGTSFFFFSLSRSLCAARQDRWRETIKKKKKFPLLTKKKNHVSASVG